MDVRSIAHSFQVPQQRWLHHERYVQLLLNILCRWVESKTIGLRVFKAIIALKIVVDVGLVVGVTPTNDTNWFSDFDQAFLFVFIDHADCFVMFDTVPNIF